MKWFSIEKGFGFIDPDEGFAPGEDVFVHFTHVRAESLLELVDGCRVEFDLIEGERGPQAVNVGVAR